MKKLLTVFFAAAVLCGLSSVTFAANGDVTGHIYSTDILAYVNGEPIDGYNIGGKTVVIAEDLSDYGFGVEYSEDTRTLNVKSYFNGAVTKKFKEIQRGKPGKILGDVYKTDIKVLFNSKEINGFNIGGRTAICLEDMGNLEDSPNADYGYSKYLGKTKWNEQDRTISFDTFFENQNEILGLSRVNHRFKDNVLYTYSDEYSSRSEISALIFNEMTTSADNEFTQTYNYSENFEKDKISPLYLDINGQRWEIGIAVAEPDSDPSNNYNRALLYIYDTDNTKALIKTAKLPQKSHDEALQYFSEKYTVVQTIENDKYTVLFINDKTDGVLFVYINKNGGFVVDTFFSSYGDYEIKVWFDTENENAGENAVAHSVYPFAGPHGATTMRYVSELDYYDYD